MTKPRHKLKSFVLTFLVAYLTVILVLTLLETAILYPAPPRNAGDWQPVGINHEDVEFASADGTRLHGWYFAHPSPRVHLLVCHGNGEHVPFLGDAAAGLRDRFDASVLVFDYRGYGRSEGRPFEAGILQDGEAAQAWLAERDGIAKSDVVLYGRSLGGGVAVHLAAENGARGLVLDRTFSSIVGIAAQRFWWVPVRRLMRNRYESEEKIARYTGPLLQLHGTADHIVPYEFGKRLHDAAGSKDKRLLTIEGFGHNGPIPGEFLDEMGRFLMRLPAVQRAPS